ncbi:DNA polymerase III subunit delta', partial [Pseudomonas aeruginosa]
FDWFCDWTLGILRYQLTHDQEGLGLADMRKVIQYLGDKSGQACPLHQQGFEKQDTVEVGLVQHFLPLLQQPVMHGQHLGLPGFVA